jgi:hypothetical protein
MRCRAAEPPRRKLLILLLGSLIVPILSSCKDEKPFRVLTVEMEGVDEEEMGAFSLNLHPNIFVPAEEGSPLKVPFRTGDRILANPDQGAWIPVFESDGDTLVFSWTEGVTRLGGRPVSLDLTKEDGWTWLGHATPDEKQSLRTVAVGDSLEPMHRRLLEDLAAHNPTLHLYAERAEVLPPLLSMFDPSGLFWERGDILGEHREALAGEQALESLMISGNEVSDLSFLAQLPDLEHLFIADWDPTDAGPLPDSLPDLKSLILAEAEFADLAALGVQPELEELIIYDCHGSEESGELDISRISDLPDLRLVAFRACEVQDLSPLVGLPRLEWLGLPQNLNQTQLEEVVGALPRLVFLELLDSDEVVDLSPLNRMEALKGLLIGSGAPPEPLFEMDHLQYLAVMAEGSSGSFPEEVVPQLMAELPETVIGRVEPFCLGSGLILLLMPMAGLFVALFGSGKGGRSTTGRHE